MLKSHFRCRVIYFANCGHASRGSYSAPLYLVMAHIAGAPGIGFHLRCAAIGTNLLFTGRASLKTCYKFLFSPMDSTRYFEFHEVWKSVEGLVFTRYLDVSSPRLMPLFLLKAAPGATAELINPDPTDRKKQRSWQECAWVEISLYVF